MALIVYPTTDWDSFVSVTRADTIIGGFVQDAGATAYIALTETEKEAILRQTALQIQLCNGIVLPDDIEYSLEYAQCYLTTHALETDMITYDPTADSVTSEAVDTLAVSYDVNRKEGNDTFPPMVTKLLSRYGCITQSGGFSMAGLGRS